MYVNRVLHLVGIVRANRWIGVNSTIWPPIKESGFVPWIAYVNECLNVGILFNFVEIGDKPVIPIS